MQYRQLGRTGVFVSQLCLGTMTFGESGAGPSPLGDLSIGDVQRIVDEAIDGGINFIDTADVYSLGNSEALVGEALQKRRNKVVLATKVSARVGPGPNDVGQSRLHIADALDGSLKRLKTDHIDLYQLHNFDRLTPLQETLEALDLAVRQGKVRYVGCSNFFAWQVVKGLGISDRRLLSRFVSVQSYYSLAGRDIERELVPAVLDEGLGLLCWSPLAGGLLSGKFDRDGSADQEARRTKLEFPPVNRPQVYDIIDVIKDIAASHGVSGAQVALAWLLSRPAVTSVIVGVKRSSQLQDNLSAADLVLTADEIDRLNQVSGAPPTYPGWIQTYRANSRFPQGYPFSGPMWGLGDTPV